jgi:ATP-dependent DNA ligase
MPIQLMLATLTDRRDFGDDWLLERKLDGERCVARKDGGDVRLESRTGKDITTTYPRSVPQWRPSGPPTSCSTARWSRTTASRRPSAGSSSAPGSPSPL